jgi:Ser-tRNA(Ala) deacylase AlaX
MFGCERSSNAHIERKKSKISYILDHKPDRKEEREIERQMNELIEQDLPVTFQFVTRAELEGIVMEAEPGSPDSRIALDRLPADASDTIRLVRIGDYDVCTCIGKHVRSTAQIGRFEMLGTNWDNDRMAFRIRYKIV